LQKKCEEYWPNDINESLFYGDIVVEMESESHLPDFILRDAIDNDYDLIFKSKFV
jgi:hypothetical protein